MIDITQHPEYIQAENIHNLKYLSFKYIGVFNAVLGNNCAVRIKNNKVIIEFIDEPKTEELFQYTGNIILKNIKARNRDLKPVNVKLKIKDHKWSCLNFKWSTETTLYKNFKYINNNNTKARTIITYEKNNQLFTINSSNRKMKEIELTKNEIKYINNRGKYGTK